MTNSSENIHLGSESRRRGKLLTLAVTVLILTAMFGFAQLVSANGATQFSGKGFFPEAGECTDPVVNDEGVGPNGALLFTGELEGCLYTWVVTSKYGPGNTLNETGYELFVAADGSGTFATTYRFTAKVEDLDTFTGVHFGRCQHPIVKGSGTGSFEGVRGRIDIQDNIVDGITIDLDYRGHLNFK